MSAITLDNVSKRYGDVHALRPLSVEFPAGKLSTIFGKSGSGKTTLLSVIAGLLKPTTGSIWYQDKDIAALTKDECAALRRTDIGVVFQDHNIINELTVLENVRLPLEANGMSRTAAITASEQALVKMGIGHLARRFPAEISGGEQQRVGIARAIAGTRTVLLADEPSGAQNIRRCKPRLDPGCLLQTGGRTAHAAIRGRPGKPPQAGSFPRCRSL